MPKTPSITPEELRQLLDYDPRTGSLEWAEPDRGWFASDAHWLAFCQMRDGAKPLTCEHSGGYLWGYIGAQAMLAHRAIWAYCHGEWPDEQLDHVNHDRRDNRLSNLRLATQAENCRNFSRRYDNSSGVTGVSWDKDRKKWVAQIALPGGKNRYLGRYSSLEDAALARKKAEIQYGFHGNHGKTAEELRKPAE